MGRAGIAMPAAYLPRCTFFRVLIVPITCSIAWAPLSGCTVVSRSPWKRTPRAYRWRFRERDRNGSRLQRKDRCKWPPCRSSGASGSKTGDKDALGVNRIVPHNRRVIPAMSEGPPSSRRWSALRNQFQHFDGLASLRCAGYPNRRSQRFGFAQADGTRGKPPVPPIANPSPVLAGRNEQSGARIRPRQERSRC
jgi:hypothetical protein